MQTFLIGIIILIVGGILYGAYCSKVFGPDNRPTPAIAKQDGVDFVPMKKWRNSLVQLLNIAGTGPILGPIQGILFGPIAFILIPIGCIFAGCVHDYMSGMISIREGGAQMPSMIKKYLGRKAFPFYNIILCFLLFTTAAVFIYTPGDMITGQIFHFSIDATSPALWLIYAVILAYYIIATLFPIDKIIGRIYPFFGLILLASTVGIFIALFSGAYQLENLTSANFMGIHPQGLPVIPVLFVTIACGILSGFHATQSTIIGRSVTHEKEGRTTFFNMMLVEGFIAMVWAAAAMGIYQKGVEANLIGTPSVVGLVSRDLLGNIGGIVAILGVVVLAITSGDTLLRSLRLTIAEYIHLDQKKAKNRLLLTAAIIIPILALLIFAKVNYSGFNILWRYFAWSNQTVAVFALAMIAVYLHQNKKNYIIALIPGTFYAFIVSSYILNATIGFHLPWPWAYSLAGLISLVYIFWIVKKGASNPASIGVK